jgi:hypothetical protein
MNYLEEIKTQYIKSDSSVLRHQCNLSLLSFSEVADLYDTDSDLKVKMESEQSEAIFKYCQKYTD